MCIYITGEKPYKCTFEGCDRAFAQMANLHHHMRNHDEHVRKAASKQFHCMICHRAYTNESSLKNHTLKVNTSKQFHCMICHRAYTNESSLKNHTLKVNSKQFHCMICHRAYTNESSLKNHTLKVNVLNEVT